MLDSGPTRPTKWSRMAKLLFIRLEKLAYKEFVRLEKLAYMEFVAGLGLGL